MRTAAMAHCSACASQRGISMIEVLVAIVVLTIGILGMAGLQAAGLRQAQSAQLRAQAAQFAYDMADRMRANLGEARGYGLALADAAPAGSSTADRDRADWLARLATLPAGDGAIEVDLTTNLVTITVQWDDTRAGGPANATYVLTTRLWNN
jgi:type IV pilus assembly protein PilV